MKNIKLLYAEDEIGTRTHHIRYIQSRYNFEIFEATDGIQALALYKQHQPDILLTDITMPGMNGLELIKEVRKISKQTKIIIITAHSEHDKLLEALNAYVVNYLIKPIDRKQLKTSLDTAIETLPISDNHTQDSFISISNNALFNEATQEYFHHNQRIKLSKSETALLSLLCKEKNKKISAYEIFNYVWDDFEKEFSDTSVRALIKKLRKKLPPNTLENIYGGFYKLVTH